MYLMEPVPLGSIFGRIYFLIYNNDLSDDIVSTVKLTSPAVIWHAVVLIHLQRSLHVLMSGFSSAPLFHQKKCASVSALSLIFNFCVFLKVSCFKKIV